MAPQSLSILVTGGAGFIGSNLVRHLLARGHRVMNVDKLTYAGNLSSLADVMDHPAHTFVRADVSDESAMSLVFADFAPERVLHLAAESHVDRSIDAPLDFIRTNITGTAILLQAARQSWGANRGERRFIHVSTDEVYGSLGESGFFTEESAYDPHSPYAASKASADHLVRAWGETYGLPVIVTHSTNNYGPYQFPEKLIPLVILKALRGEPAPVYGDGRQVRDWLHVEDHCSALALIAERGAAGETYHVGAHQERRNIEVVGLILEEIARLRPDLPRLGLQHVPDRPGHDFRYALDASKLMETLGWKPARTFSEGLAETVKWYLENESWWKPVLSGDYRLQRLGGG